MYKKQASRKSKIESNRIVESAIPITVLCSDVRDELASRRAIASKRSGSHAQAGLRAGVPSLGLRANLEILFCYFAAFILLITAVFGFV